MKELGDLQEGLFPALYPRRTLKHAKQSQLPLAFFDPDPFLSLNDDQFRTTF